MPQLIIRWATNLTCKFLSSKAQPKFLGVWPMLSTSLPKLGLVPCDQLIMKTKEAKYPWLILIWNSKSPRTNTNTPMENPSQTLRLYSLNGPRGIPPGRRDCTGGIPLGHQDCIVLIAWPPRHPLPTGELDSVLARWKGSLLTSWIMYQLVGRSPFRQAGLCTSLLKGTPFDELV
jgi:hypothetical protein